MVLTDPEATPMPIEATMAAQQHRVLIYTTCYNVIDGVTLTIRKIEEQILAAGHQVCILSTDSGNSQNTNLVSEHPNRTVIFLDNSVPIPFLHDPQNVDSSYSLGFSLGKSTKDQISQFDPTIVHVTAPDCTCLHVIQYARDHEIPLMGTYHSNIPEYMDHYPGLGWLKHVLASFFRHQYNFLQALYVPTPYIHKQLRESSKMDCVTDLGVWGRGIDLSRFSPTHRTRKFRESLGFDDHDVVICWVGRLVPEKRPDIFASVIKRLASRNIPFKALVIGAGPCEESMKALPNTVFAGWMSGDELSTAYASSDVFLFSSGVETFGNVTLEAAASGLPIIVEEGCSGHLVQHGRNGFACANGDVDAFYDATLCLVLDDERRNLMSHASRQFSLQFEKSVVCRRMLDNYTKVTKQFFDEYGGHHANRDAEYHKEHSFVGGNYPRPFLLQMFEYLFVVLFQVMYQMATFFIHVRDSFPLASTNKQRVTAAAVTTKKVAPQSPTSAAKQQPTMATLGSASEAETQPLMADADDDVELGRIEEVEEISDSDTDFESQNAPLQTIDMDKDMECETETTVSSSSERSQEQSQGSMVCFGKQKKSKNDIYVSHEITKAIIRLVFFQFLIECRTRDFFGYVLSPSKWTTISVGRRRKNN